MYLAEWYKSDLAHVIYDHVYEDFLIYPKGCSSSVIHILVILFTSSQEVVVFSLVLSGKCLVLTMDQLWH